MKYIVLSDSHGNKDGVSQLLSTVNHNGVIFAGDGTADFDNVHGEVLMCRGNCDFFSKVPTDVFKEINGTKVMITHGHLYNAKSGMGGLINVAKQYNVNLVIFGHTHNTFFEEIDGITFLNPGTFKKSLFNKSNYAVIDFNDSGFLINLLEF